MSREIKFRCWNEHGKVMHDWSELVEGNKIHLLNAKNPTYKIMQFTGLKDRNVIEIYEGDIVAVNESHKLLGADFGKNKRVVQWREGGACLDMLHVDYLDSKRKVGLTFDNGMVDSIEVVGNIYENPELLTPKPTANT